LFILAQILCRYSSTASICCPPLAKADFQWAQRTWFFSSGAIYCHFSLNVLLACSSWKPRWGRKAWRNVASVPITRLSAHWFRVFFVI
jgi:hypothetical protein